MARGGVATLCLLALWPGQATASVLTDWNVIGIEQLRSAGLPAPDATRALAIAQLSAFEAINATSHDFAPLRPGLEVTEPVNAQAAAASALHDAWVALLPDYKSDFDRALAETLSSLEPGEATDNGRELGGRAAAELLALRQGDGAAAVSSYPGNEEPGKWRPTPRASAAPGVDPLPALAPAWRLLTPFALTRPQDFRPPAPPAITSNEFTVDYLQVKGDGVLASVTRSDDQTELAQLWSQPGHVVFNLVARTLATRKSLSLAAEARLYALLDVALADALVAAWDAKYQYGFWRPISAVRTADDYGNPNTVPNPLWSPLLETPNSPGYPSELSASGAAALAVLKSVFGDEAFALHSSTSAHVRSFASFDAAEDELTESVPYSGVDFRFSAEAGRALGRQVGEQVVASILREPGMADGGGAGGGGAGAGAAGVAGQSDETPGGQPAQAGAAESTSAGEASATTAGAASTDTPHGRHDPSGCALARTHEASLSGWGLLLALVLRRRQRTQRTACC
jgi:large repetitive protein